MTPRHDALPATSADQPPADDGTVRLDLGDVLAAADPDGAYGDAEPSAPPLIGPDGRVRLSFSRIDAYRSCPLRFRFSYIDRLPSAPATYLSFGTSIHAALEAFHDRTLFGMPSEEDLLGFLYDGWDSSGFHREPREVQVREYRRAQDVLRRYHRRVRDDYRPAAETEKWFELPVGDHATVVGSIDRIDVDDDGAYHVVDYKTGQAARPPAACAGRCSWPSTRWPASTSSARCPATVSLDFVVAGTEVRVPLDELDLDAARQAVDDTARAVLDEAYEPTPVAAVRLVRPPRRCAPPGRARARTCSARPWWPSNRPAATPGGLPSDVRRLRGGAGAGARRPDRPRPRPGRRGQRGDLHE